MSVRWFVMLALVLGVVAVSVSSYLWLSHSTLLARAGVRQSRVEQQFLEQQLVQLKNLENQGPIQGLQQSMQGLQMELVELLSRSNVSPGIVSLDFEQSVLKTLIPGGSTTDIKTLRLVVSLTARHSSAILSFLANIRLSVIAWPNEVRACDFERMPTGVISAQCVIDFYHWANLSEPQ